MLKIFLGNRAGVLFLIPILVIGYFMLEYQTNHYSINAMLDYGCWGKLKTGLPFFVKIGAGSLICINAFFINWLFNTNGYFERNHYICSLLYVVLMSFYHSFFNLDGMLISHTFVLLMLYQFYKLNQNHDGRKNVFNGAFFAGIAATFHPPLVLLLPSLFIMVWIIRPFILREFMLVLTGFLLPLFYAAVYMLYFNYTVDIPFLMQLTHYSVQQVDFLIRAVLFTLLFILGLISIGLRMQKSTIRLKKLVGILWVLLFIGVLLGTLNFFIFKQIEAFSFLVLPLSFFLAFAFTNQTFNWMASILFYATFAYSAFNFFL